MIKDSRR